MIFVALTQGMAPAIRRNIAIQSCLTAVIILTAFAAFGEAVLGFVGVSIAAFRVAVDALLFLTALNMLFERRTKRCEDQVGKEEHSNLFSVSFGYSADCRFRINYNDHPAGWSKLERSRNCNHMCCNVGCHGRGLHVLSDRRSDRALSGQNLSRVVLA